MRVQKMFVASTTFLRSELVVPIDLLNMCSVVEFVTIYCTHDLSGEENIPG